MTQEQKDWWNKNYFTTPEARSKFLGMTDAERKQEMSNINQVNQLNRDSTLNADYAKQSFDRKMADAQAQSDIQNKKAKAELESQVNNFAIAQGTQGR